MTVLFKSLLQQMLGHPVRIAETECRSLGDAHCTWELYP